MFLNRIYINLFLMICDSIKWYCTKCENNIENGLCNQQKVKYCCI